MHWGLDIIDLASNPTQKLKKGGEHYVPTTSDETPGRNIIKIWICFQTVGRGTYLQSTTYKGWKVKALVSEFLTVPKNGLLYKQDLSKLYVLLHNEKDVEFGGDIQEAIIGMPKRLQNEKRGEKG